jgi:hypothetical protein
MPVTAKLSRRFYETFGDEIANELVEWFNSVDATYRSDLRELNELNYARFDAKLEQRMAELRQELAHGMAELRQELAQGMAALRQELGQSSAGSANQVALLRQETTQAIAAVRAEIYTLRGHTDTGFETLRTELANQRAELVKWMFLFWLPTVLALIGLYFRH